MAEFGQIDVERHLLSNGPLYTISLTWANAVLGNYETAYECMSRLYILRDDIDRAIEYLRRHDT